MQVGILPVGDVHTTVRTAAEQAIEEAYGATVTRLSSVPLPSETYDEEREQYDAEGIIDRLPADSGYDTILVLTPVDLYFDDRTFVFGLAQLGGVESIVSTYRLREDADGDGFTDPETAAERVRKEVVHEVGHTLGYTHCSNPGCVMNFSPNVAGIDRKSESLCSTCRDKQPKRDDASEPASISDGSR